MKTRLIILSLALGLFCAVQFYAVYYLENKLIQQQDENSKLKIENAKLRAKNDLLEEKLYKPSEPINNRRRRDGSIIGHNGEIILTVPAPQRYKDF